MAEERGATVSLNHLIKLRGQSRGLGMGAGKRVATVLAGNYISSFRGRGMDFDEVRAYQPGDDIRSMDWRVTARTGRAHTKLYREERERPVFFLVDHSPEMHFGTRSAFKSVIAAEIAALLAWAAGDSGDRIGGIVFNGDGHIELRPSGGQRGVLRLLKAVIDAPRASHTDPASLTHALARLRHVVRPGSQIVVLSDFRHLDADGERHLSYLSKHNDLLAVFIFDALERELPPPGRYNVSDGHDIFAIDTRGAKQRRHYRQQFDQRRQSIDTLFRKHGVKLFDMATDDDVVAVLRRVLGVAY